MRLPRPRIALLCATTLGVGGSLAGCGSSSGLLPADDAGRLQSALQDAQSAYDGGRCQDAAAAVREGRERISGLPGSTDAELVRTLERGFVNLRSRISSTCQELPTTTEEAPPPTEEVPVPTEVVPPPSTEEVPPSTEEEPEPELDDDDDDGDDGGEGTDEGPVGGGPDVPGAASDGAGTGAPGRAGREERRGMRERGRGRGPR